ncbi:MAG TPA: GAF domain-containing protein [Ohtaekwangia sp.]|uniref:GAF domain-containing protein n=1 Tax=Ohtaekwangia sp. TaxID=2066019 RepID=UPI002F91E1A3
MKKLLTLIRGNIIVVLIAFVSILLVVNVMLIFHNKSIIVRNNQIMRESEYITYKTNQLVGFTLHNIDLGIRAYGILKNDEMYSPAETAIKQIDEAFDNLKASVAVHGYDGAPLEELRKTYHDYVDFIGVMKQMAAIDSMATFRKMLEEDRGLKVFIHWDKVGSKILNFETELKAKAEAEYQSAVNNNLYLQIVSLLIGLPTLGYVVLKLRNDWRDRLNLLIELEENNRKYIFNPGTSLQIDDPKQVIENSIFNLQQASEFIENIADGKYTAEWKDLGETNIALNETNLAGRLTNMREQLKQMKREEERRLWTNEGLTKFSETVRNHQNNLAELSNEVIRFITRYMGAQQGGLFVLREEDGSSYLELSASYAFDRKKFIERRIEIGVGLIGQAYLEGETTLLTKLPQGYTYITSGMGEATPGCLVIVPMKYNDKTEAIIELASLEKFEDYQVAFLEKAGEFVASALQSVRTTEKMQELLTASQRQTEEMRATEEEMRQNLEELQATQEAMVRKQEELDRMREEENERAKKVAESNRQATNRIIEKLKATEEELRRLKNGD